MVIFLTFCIKRHAEEAQRLDRDRYRLCITASRAERPGINMLLCFMLFLASGVVLSFDCPGDCSCQTQSSIFCIRRSFSAVPQVPVSTQFLYIFQNTITTLTKDDFNGLVELEMLDVSQNELTEIPDGVFEKLSKLKNLDLSLNRITHISKDSFSGLVQLERLYLHANRIQSIHVEAFDNLWMLLELKLQGNQLVSLPSFNFPSLLLLDLSNNNIQTLEPSDFQIPHLETLKMASLGLTSLDEDLIASLKNLHELDISINKLHEVPLALKQNSLKGLIRLSLAGNPLPELRVSDFEKLVGLQELDLSGLNLQGFPERFFETFPKLTQLTAAENPFNCLCPLAWFPVWLEEKGVFLRRPEETRCHFPLVNAGKMLSALEHKDFGCPLTTTESTDSPFANTLVPQMPTTSPKTTHTNAILAPPPPSKETIYSKTDNYALPPEPPVSPTSTSGEYVRHFCPGNICLNGGTCDFDPLGQLICWCPTGTSGVYCENVDEVLEPPHPSATEMPVDAPVIPENPETISSRQVTSTSILLDLHRFIETRPHIRGIRLTYRNLSGPDRRPMILSLPTSYPEYTLRGLKPNCTYSVCASPLGERINSRSNNSVEMGSCTEARTDGVAAASSGTGMEAETSVKYTLISALAALALVLGLAVVAGIIICLRKRRKDNAGMELELGPADADPMELDGIKACLENGLNGIIPLKQPETDLCQTTLPPLLLQSNGGLDYEAPLMQSHCASNNNVTSLKPSYF